MGCDKIREGENPKRRKISIHAPRVGCDLKQQHPTRLRTNNFNPRTPGGVRPSTTKPRLFARSIFQSTHPGWGATSSLRPPSAVKVKFQSTHPGWGATGRAGSSGRSQLSFQSTHPGWGATSSPKGKKIRSVEFQSTHPGWGATMDVTDLKAGIKISIHAPRVGCDSMRLIIHGTLGVDFNPRTPGGVRHSSIRQIQPITHQFQSTHPGWGATRAKKLHQGIIKISIHAPRVGCDKINVPPKSKEPKFQSTHPGWGATFRRPVRPALPHISIHAPRVGCDRRIVKRCIHSRDFNPRTPGGVRRMCRRSLCVPSYFNPRTPGGVRLSARRQSA